MKIISIISISFLVFCNSVAFSQVDSKAEEILQKVSAKTTSYKSLLLEFELNNKTSGDDVGNDFEGSLLIKDNNFRLKTPRFEIYSNSLSESLYVIDNMEVNINEKDTSEANFLSNPRFLFSDYNKNFKYAIVGESLIGTDKVTEIDLIPLSMDQSFFRVQLLVDNSNTIRELQYFAKDGSVTAINILSQTDGGDVSESTFTFNPTDYPDVEVIDLR